MTPSEKLVIFDFLNRKRWYYIGGLLFHLISMITCWWKWEVSLLGLLPCSAALLLFEQIRGQSSARTLLTLPITPCQLGNVWRTATFTLPALAAATILSISVMVAAVFKAPLLNPLGFLIIAFTQTAVLGTMLFFLTGPPPLGRNSRLNLLFRKSFMTLWAFSLPAIMILSRNVPKNAEEIGIVQLLAGLIMGAATLVAWFGCNRLVEDRSGQPSAAKNESAKSFVSHKSALAPRFGGIPYLIARIGTQMFYMTASTILIFRMITFFDGSSSGSGRSSPLTTMLLPMFGFIAIQMMVSQLRLLRCMPISRAALTHLLLFTPMLLLSCIGLIGSGIDLAIHRGTLQATAWPLLIPTMVLATTFLPINLRFGTRSWIFMVSMFPLIFFNIMISEQGFTMIPILVLIPLTCAILAINWAISYRLLASHHPWRASAIKASFRAS